LLPFIVGVGVAVAVVGVVAIAVVVVEGVFRRGAAAAAAMRRFGASLRVFDADNGGGEDTVVGIADGTNTFGGDDDGTNTFGCACC
jgi:hypothetical protein